MSFLNFLQNIFNKQPQNPYNLCVRTIKKMRYKNNGGGCFIKENSSGRTMIWLSESGVKIKVYAHGYSESDFYPAPLPDAENLKKFIRGNEL